jgi:hypothetical protein
MSSLVKNLALFRRYKISLIKGIRYRSFLVILLSLRKSIQKRRVLSSFLTNKTRDTKSIELFLINPFLRLSSK